MKRAMKIFELICFYENHSDFTKTDINPVFHILEGNLKLCLKNAREGTVKPAKGRS